MLCWHFFDDYYAVLRETEAPTAMFCIREAFSLIGLVLDPEKSQPPAQVAMVLGVAFNTQSLKEQRVLLVEPKPTRVSNFCQMIDKVLEDNALSSSLAASLLGKFGFLCSTMYGKVGRCCTGALRARQYQNTDEISLTHQMRTCLNLMKIFVITKAPSRRMNLSEVVPPIILYTDASDVPDRADGRWIVGGVLIDPLDLQTIEYFHWIVPPAVVNQWHQRSNYMGQLEVLACPIALSTWKRRLFQRQVIMWIDNDSAAANLIRGYSPKGDSSNLVGHFWLLASDCQAEIYIDRVESKSNLSDGPSRLDFTFVQQLSASSTPPVFDFCFTQFPGSLSADGAPSTIRPSITCCGPQHIAGKETHNNLWKTGFPPSIEGESSDECVQVSRSHLRPDTIHLKRG